MPIVWLFGLSGAGKTTLADAFASRLRLQGAPAVRLDGDDLRRGLCADLGYDAVSRAENLRRAAHVARLMSEAGLLVVSAFITPLESDREIVREILGDRLILAFVDTDLAECERRDPKGHYRRARAGEIADFTGVSSPFEIPTDPDVALSTMNGSVSDLVDVLLHRVAAPEPEFAI